MLGGLICSHDGRKLRKIPLMGVRRKDRVIFVKYFPNFLAGWKTLFIQVASRAFF